VFYTVFVYCNPIIFLIFALLVINKAKIKKIYKELFN
jgi:hypothetical protein